MVKVQVVASPATFFDRPGGNGRLVKRTIQSAKAASVLTLAALFLLLGPGASAQTVPAGAAAPVPLLPLSPVPPPNTSVPGALADIPVISVTFSYFGPWAVVQELTLPQRVVAVAPIGCHASPNATPEETQAGVTFGEKPAGSEFIVFFVRGARSYAFDVGQGNYCWIDNNISRS
jgi:hypothetical protein